MYNIAGDAPVMKAPNTIEKANKIGSYVFQLNLLYCPHPPHLRIRTLKIKTLLSQNPYKTQLVLMVIPLANTYDSTRLITNLGKLHYTTVVVTNAINDVINYDGNYNEM